MDRRNQGLDGKERNGCELVSTIHVCCVVIWRAQGFVDQAEHPAATTTTTPSVPRNGPFLTRYPSIDSTFPENAGISSKFRSNESSLESNCEISPSKRGDPNFPPYRIYLRRRPSGRFRNAIRSPTASLSTKARTATGENSYRTNSRARHRA
jgi:hypothetical protein